MIFLSILKSLFEKKYLYIWWSILYISSHPKYHVIVNNVSKHGDIIDNIDKVENDPTNSSLNAENNQKRIENIKTQLKDGAKAFYLGALVSDSTRIGQKTWKDIKEEVC